MDFNQHKMRKLKELNILINLKPMFSLCSCGRSPLNSLSAHYEQSGSSGESVPTAVTSIEQLLERQWSEGQQFLQEQGTTSDSKCSLRAGQVK